MAIKIETYQEPTKVNPFEEDINELNTAQEKTEETIIGYITVETKNANRDKLAISKAANAIGKTASFKSTTADKGKTTFGIVLVKRHKARRGK